MVRGWFIGPFSPTAFSTENCEVTNKMIPIGYGEPKHYYKIATEVVLITSGKFKINDREYNKGDIVVIEPGETIESYAITDSEIIVVKIPVVKNDKYLVNNS